MNSIQLKSLKMSILAMCKPKTPIDNTVEEILLAKNMSPRKEVWENLGFKFKESDETNIVIEAKLPDGWTITPVQNYRYEIADNKGFIRAQMYYREDFNGRSASMRLLKKYQVYSVSERREVEGKKDNITVTVVYFGSEHERVYVAGEYAVEDYCSDKDYADYIESIADATKVATEYAKKYYPNWESPIAYWDEEPNKTMKLK